MAEFCRALPGEAAAVVRARTGLRLDAMFSAPKMRWLLDAAVAAGADRADLVLGTVDAFLVYRLTGELAIEVGNASRTLLLDLRTGDWQADLLDLFGVPGSVLPVVRPSDGGFGTTRAYRGLPAGVPVVAVLGDSHAALYAHGCTTPGTGKATYGTGSSVMVPVAGPDVAPDGVMTTLAWVVDGRPAYAREGNIVANGSALDWMAATLGLVRGRSGGAEVSALAARAPDSGGVSLVPAFAGLGAPTWDRAAVGLLSGLTAGTTPAQLARAALEAVAHQVADVVEAIESDGAAHLGVLHADGGATGSGLLMQVQADLLGRPVVVADAAEASALGVGLLAARTLGLATTGSIESGRLVEPALAPAARRVARAAWRQAVARSRGLALTTDS